MDLLCFSHLGWDFVFQRPQHLLTRAARTMRVTYWEEPTWVEHGTPGLETRTTPEGVLVVRPRLPWGADHDATLRALLDGFIAERGIQDPALWFYTPGALAFAGHLRGNPVVYDCMDELAAFAGADPDLPLRERALMARAALVFTGGRSLFEAKRRLHPAVHAFPSGVDAAHFRAARAPLPEPAAQRDIPYPRAGFYGVLDERLDTSLLSAVAALCPDIHFVLVGPVAKIDASELPQAANLHYPGPAPYAELPNYLAGWDVALMPFAMNAATRFISPTKLPEYLAGGRPVVSTPVADVVAGWSGVPGVTIASDPAEFAQAVRQAIALRGQDWTGPADRIIGSMSWDGIWRRMSALLADARTPPTDALAAD